MTEWKRAWVGAVVGIVVTSGAAWAVRGNEMDTSSLVRMAVLEKVVESNAIAIAGLTSHVESLSENQVQTFTNAKNIGELTAEVREILKAVTRLEALNDAQKR